MQKTASVFSVISFVTGLIMPVLFLIFYLSGMFNAEDYVSHIVFTVLASCLWTVPGLVLGVLAQKHRTKVKKTERLGIRAECRFFGADGVFIDGDHNGEAKRVILLKGVTACFRSTPLRAFRFMNS